MSPSELSASLRRIAAGIDKSKNPDRKLVAKDIKSLLASVEGEAPVASLEVPAVEAAPVAAPAALSPTAAAEAIQAIATKLASSKNPDRSAVIHDIKNVINALS